METRTLDRVEKEIVALMFARRQLTHEERQILVALREERRKLGGQRGIDLRHLIQK